MTQQGTTYNDGPNRYSEFSAHKLLADDVEYLVGEDLSGSGLIDALRLRGQHPNGLFFLLIHTGQLL